MGSINIVELWNQMGGIARGVVIILALMSAWSFAVMIERWLTYRQARKQSRMFTPAVAEVLKDGKIEEAIALGEQYNKSHLARCWYRAAGLKPYGKAGRSGKPWTAPAAATAYRHLY